MDATFEKVGIVELKLLHAGDRQDLIWEREQGPVDPNVHRCRCRGEVICMGLNLHQFIIHELE